MHIYFVRHGHSACNEVNRFAGHFDARLTELGRRQADCVPLYFRDMSVDAVFSSPLQRAQNTIAPTAEMLGLPILTDEDLKEIDGGRWEYYRLENLERDYPEQGYLWKNDVGSCHCPEGECFDEVVHRVESALRRLLADTAYQSVIICTHGGVLRALFAYWQTGSVSAMRTTTWPPNASVSTVEYENDRFTVQTVGDCRHLGELIAPPLLI